MDPDSHTRNVVQAKQLAAALRRTGRRLVFAESCTAGWCAALLSRVPGISEFLCGSAVTYQNATKEHWLQVSAADLNDPGIGPVSETVARQMALGALRTTPQAELAVSVTGHLGPGAPAELDGVIYLGVARREGDSLQVLSVTRYQLLDGEADELARRHARQQAAVSHVYEATLKVLGSS